LRERIEREKPDAMSMRVRQLWAPVLSTFLISVAVQFVALRVPQLPPWVFFTRNGVSIVLAPLWMLALPFIGALGAWLSLRAGGNPRDRLLTALGSAWLNGAILSWGSAVEDHRTPLLAEHQADRLHRVHDRLVPDPGGLAGARGPAVAGTQGHDARPGRHRPLATPIFS
jgi:hypothetical protein